MHGPSPDLLWAAPFAGLLLAIALLPLLLPRLWRRLEFQAIIAVAFALPVASFYLKHAPAALAYSITHYVSFVVLIAALFVISGGIGISGVFKNTPAGNACLLGFGAVLANFIGTTGASMVLIRPLLLANAYRKHHAHLVICFIMFGSNIGGLLTPLGDPPLFLGFLSGVPFFWTLKLFPIWLFAVVLLLVCFFLTDRYFCARESAFAERDALAPMPLRLKGKRNLGLLLAVLSAMFMPTPWRELLMAGAGCLSFFVTPREYHEENDFSFTPILEVAILFFGIFVTMVPALAILEHRGGELGVGEPWQFFWLTGFFSSFLDNAPTYLTFVALGQGLGQTGPHLALPEPILAAISVGAVFFGANTYIGNAPNFMVRSIAVELGWKMPTFFGYMARVAVFLIPLFILVTLLFFR